MARNWTKFWTKLGSANLIVEELNPYSNWLALVGPNAQLCWTHHLPFGDPAVGDRSRSGCADTRHKA